MAGLKEPIKVGNLEIKNRLVLPPMATNYSTSFGEVTDRLKRHYAERARAGNGLVIVEHAYVKKNGRMHPNQLGVYDFLLVEGLTELAEAIKDENAKAVMQINHAGARTSAKFTGEELVSASTVPSPDFNEIPVGLDIEGIGELVETFGEAARRVKAAGFDGVEIHGAHGFLLNQFLSPITNLRDDEYGGDFERRCRFPLEVVKKVKERIGESFPLFYRLGADDMVPGGLTVEDTKKFALLLRQEGVILLDVSGGLIGSRPEGMESQGYFVKQASEIRKAVGLPVIGVGGIRDPLYADQIIRNGEVDLVAVGRPQLKDPEWAKNALAKICCNSL